MSQKGSGAAEGLSAFFRRLRTERERQGLTLEWIADKSDVTKQAISQYETDTTGRARPAERVLRKWLRALALDESWYEEWEELRAVENVLVEMDKLGIEDRDNRRAIALVVRSAVRETRRGGGS